MSVLLESKAGFSLIGWVRLLMSQGHGSDLLSGPVSVTLSLGILLITREPGVNAGLRLRKASSTAGKGLRRTHPLRSPLTKMNTLQ